MKLKNIQMIFFGLFPFRFRIHFNETGQEYIADIISKKIN